MPGRTGENSPITTKAANSYVTSYYLMPPALKVKKILDEYAKIIYPHAGWWRATLKPIEGSTPNFYYEVKVTYVNELHVDKVVERDLKTGRQINHSTKNWEQVPQIKKKIDEISKKLKELD
ncbi:MAG: hypothetical protein ACHQ03_07600 [Candidatus Bathyarchaeia archaeon]